jgi:hypothetical protein
MTVDNGTANGSEKMTVDLRAGSTLYLAAEPQLGLVTPGQITLIQVTETSGARTSPCGRA